MLRQELESIAKKASLLQLELDGIRQNRDVVRDLMKDLEKENRGLKS